MSWMFINQDIVFQELVRTELILPSQMTSFHYMLRKLQEACSLPSNKLMENYALSYVAIPSDGALFFSLLNP